MVKQNYGVGDLFEVPLEGGRRGVGQVVAMVAEYDEPYLIAYDVVFGPEDDIVPEDLVRQKLLVLAAFEDDRLTDGTWKVLARARVPEDLPLPATRVISAGARVVLDRVSGRSRAATPQEWAELPNLKISSSNTLEGALEARAGLRDWTARYEGLRPKPEIAATRYFGAE